MSKRKRPARTARSRINAPRPTGTSARTTAPAAHTAGAGKGLWLYGFHAVTAALLNPARKRHRLIATKQAADALKDTSGNDLSGIMDTEIVDRSEIDAVCGPDSVHQGLALLVSPLADLYIEDVIADAEQATDTRFPVGSTAPISNSAEPSRPRHQYPASFSAHMARARLVTRTIETYSSAPDAALAMAPVSGGALRSCRITALTPKALAERSTAPILRGSVA